MKRKYIILIAFGKDNTPLGLKLSKICREKFDPDAHPHWRDDKGLGICVFTEWDSGSMYRELQQHCRKSHPGFLEHLAVLELADDHASQEGSRLLAWARQCSAQSQTPQ